MKIHNKVVGGLLLVMALAGCSPVKEDKQVDTSEDNTVISGTVSKKTLGESVVEQAVKERLSMAEELDPEQGEQVKFLEETYDFVNRLGQYYIVFDEDEYLRRAEELKPGWVDPDGLAVEIHQEEQNIHLPDLSELIEPSYGHGDVEPTKASRLKQYLDDGYVLEKEKTRVFELSISHSAVLSFNKGDDRVGVVVARPYGEGYEKLFTVDWIVEEGE